MYYCKAFVKGVGGIKVACFIGRKKGFVGEMDDYPYYFELFLFFYQMVVGGTLVMELFLRKKSSHDDTYTYTTLHTPYAMWTIITLGK